MPLVRRNLTCFYCNTRSSQRYTKGLSRWNCQSCDSVNYLDGNGDITDPPVASSPISSIQYARPASPPLGKQGDEEIFCRTCLKNQMILTEALASYLPPPTDPRYGEFEKTLPAHKKSLEERYPQVCGACAPRVREKIRQAGYNAKTDHLRRMVQRTRNQQALPRQLSWKEYLVIMTGYVWWTNILGQVAWSFGEIIKSRLGYSLDLENGMTFAKCMLDQRYTILECFAYLPLDRVARLSLFLGVLTIWWNNRLLEKLRTPRARFLGIGDHVVRQVIMLAVRAVAWLCLHRQDPTDDIVWGSHAVLLVTTIFAALQSTRTVTLKRYSPIFVQTVDPLQDISSAPAASAGNNLLLTASQLSLSDTPFKTTNTLYSSNFPIDALADPLVPPSPVSVATSRFTRSYETTSEDSLDSDNSFDPDSENAMDWTPTGPQAKSNTSQAQSRYKFRKAAPKVKPTSGLFASLGQNPPATRPQDQINGIGPNPFQSPVPPAPSNPAKRLRNPPVTTGFRRVSAGLQNRFFDQVMGRDPSIDDQDGQRGFKGRTVNELEPARLKLKEEERTTGLEGIFDQVFSLGETSTADNRSPHRNRAMQANESAAGPDATVNMQINPVYGQRRLTIGLVIAITALVALTYVWTTVERMVDRARYVHSQEDSIHSEAF